MASPWPSLNQAQQMILGLCWTVAPGVQPAVKQERLSVPRAVPASLAQGWCWAPMPEADCPSHGQGCPPLPLPRQHSRSHRGTRRWGQRQGLLARRGRGRLQARGTQSCLMLELELLQARGKRSSRHCLLQINLHCQNFE